MIEFIVTLNFWRIIREILFFYFFFFVHSRSILDLLG